MINAFISECVELRTYNLIVNIIKKKKNYVAICSMELSRTRNVMPLVIEVDYSIYSVLLFITLPFLTFENYLWISVSLCEDRAKETFCGRNGPNPFYMNKLVTISTKSK